MCIKGKLHQTYKMLCEGKKLIFLFAMWANTGDTCASLSLQPCMKKIIPGHCMQ
jgi:hypothetical protein